MVHWTGWICTAVLLSEFLTWIARKLKVKKLMHFRGKHHIMWGKVLLGLVTVHALVAGFGAGALITVSGIIAFLGLIVLLLSYQKRAKLGKNWLKLHRWTAAASLAIVIVHITAHMAMN